MGTSEPNNRYICNRCISREKITMQIFTHKHRDYERLRHLKGSVVVIDAIIGAGKTSLGSKLYEYLQEVGIPVHFFEEEVDDSFLALFLSDTKKYAYAFQMHMLANRQKVYMAALHYARQQNGVSIVDRSLFGDAAFCSLHHEYGNITHDEYNVYRNIVGKTCLPYPSVVLYLDVTPETALKRITARNRGSEVSSYNIEYLRDLSESYQNTFQECKTPITKVDWNQDRDLSRDDLLHVCGLLDTYE